MRCPVCGALIKPLEEFCFNCVSGWDDRQQDCPAKLSFGDGYHPEIKCNLSFRHGERGNNNNKKHRAYLAGPPRITFLWDYDTRESKTAGTQAT